MKVLLVNGSPHEHGCTRAALDEVAKELAAQGVESEVFWLGLDPIAGCIGCGVCRQAGRCFRDDCVNAFAAKAVAADGFVFGSPVHWASASGAITSFMDRVFSTVGGQLRGKPAACVVSARRAGTTAALDQLLKYFYICGLPIVPSQYWAMVHGAKPEDVAQDLEGLQTMRTLARNMAWMLKCFEAGRRAGIDLQQREPPVRTNFVR
ncbi:MAG: flavodoxin family protein [Kiritimatiellia bacterium]